MTDQKLAEANKLKTNIDELGEVLSKLNGDVTEIYVVTRQGTSIIDRRIYEEMVDKVVNIIKEGASSMIKELRTEFEEL